MSRISLTLTGMLALLVLLGLWIVDMWAGTFPVLWRFVGIIVTLAFISEWWLDRLIGVAARADVPDVIRLGPEFRVLVTVISTRPRLVKEIRLVRSMAFTTIETSRNANDNIEVHLAALRAGEHSVGEVYARISGFFGLTAWDRKLDCDLDVEVLPRRLESTSEFAGLQREGAAKDARLGSGYELLRLRDYQYGDAFREIDWKATARTGKKVVRVFTQDTSLDLMIVVDRSIQGRFETCGLERLSHFVNVSSRLAECAIRSGDRVGLAAYGVGQVNVIPPAGTIRQLRLLQSSLAGLKVDEGQSNHLSAYFQVSKVLPRRSLIVFLTHLDQVGTSDHLLRSVAMASGKHMTMIAAIKDSELLSMRGGDARSWQDPYVALTAGQQIHSAEYQAHSIRRGGARLVYCDAEVLDQEIIGLYKEIRQRRLVA